MEDHEDYKAVQAKLKFLCDELERLKDNSVALAKRQSELHKDIEIHFDELIEALNARKNVFLLSVDKIYLELKKKEEEQEQEVKEKIEATNQLLGSSLFKFQPASASYIWQSIHKITLQRETTNVQVILPPKLKELINKHGEVLPLNPRSYVPALVEKKEIQYKAIEVKTLVGSTAGNVNGKGSNAKMNRPFDLVYNSIDCHLYVSDLMNNMIKQVSRYGEVKTFLDTQSVYIAYYKKGNYFFVSDYRVHSIKVVSATGQIRVLAGSGQPGYKDGEGEKAMFNCPHGITVDQETGDVYVVDCKNRAVRKITPQGITTTTTISDKLFSIYGWPFGLTFHSQQQALIMCSYQKNIIQHISLRKMTSLCDIPSPQCAVVLPNGSILVSSRSNLIFIVSFEGGVTKKEVFAGTGDQGKRDGLPLESQFNNPSGMAIVGTTCLVADCGNHRIRAITFTE